LEPAEYDEYDEEIAVGHSDDFASTEWEEVDTVTKYALAIDATVMCHRCWLKKQNALIRVVETHFNDWCASPGTSIRHIVKSLKVVNYLSLEKEMPSETITKVNQLRIMTKRIMLGKNEEEE